MRKTCILTVALLYGCAASQTDTTSAIQATENQPAKSDDKTVQIVSPEAELMIGSLFQSGVRDPQNDPKRLHLVAQEVRCTADVVPNPVPSCTVKIGAKTLEMPAGPASAIYGILKNHGATMQTDRSDISLFGMKKVDCTRVMDHYTIKCSFEISSVKDGSSS